MFKDKIVDFYLDKSLAYCRIFKIKKAIETVNNALWLDKDNVETLIGKGGEIDGLPFQTLTPLKLTLSDGIGGRLENRQPQI